MDRFLSSPLPRHADNANTKVSVEKSKKSSGESKGAQLFSENANPELDHKVKKVTEKFSENLHIVANEPSLAFYRIQEHVRKSMPQLVEQRHEVEELHQQVQGSCFDMEYAAGAVRTMNQSRVHFQNIQDLLKNSMFMKQQIEYENNRRRSSLAAVTD